MRLVVARADDLRAAGITSIGWNGCTATIGPLPDVPVPVDAKATPAEEEYPDPLHDPASYPDGRVPGFDIEKYKTPEDY